MSCGQLLSDDDSQTAVASPRAIRRHHYERLKKNRKDYWGYARDEKPGGMPPRILGMVAQTPAACSCWMCNRPRKIFGDLTLQEQRQMQPLFHEAADCKD